MIEFLAPVATTLVAAEVASWLLRNLAEVEKLASIVKNILLFIASVLSLLFVVGGSGAAAYFSSLFVFQSFENGSDVDFSFVALIFCTQFIAALTTVHFIGYCFSGALHRIPPKNKFWPKGIDYFYYSFGVAALFIITANILNNEAFVSRGIRAEVIVGVYLFSLKIYKTSYEICSVFKEKDGWVRDPFFGKIF